MSSSALWTAWRGVGTLWFVVALMLCCAATCVCQVLCRAVLGLVVALPRGREAYDKALSRWVGGIFAGGAMALCLLMAPFWSVTVVDGVPSRQLGDASDSRGVAAGQAAPRTRKRGSDVFETSDITRAAKGVPTGMPYPSRSLFGLLLEQWLLPALTGKKTVTVPDVGAGLVMSNHLSNTDGFIVRAITLGWLNGCRMPYKASLNKVPLFGWAFKLAHDLPIAFTGKNDFSVTSGTVGVLMEKAKIHLGQSMPVALFPEGARSPTGELMPFRDGFFRLAVEQQIDIFPIAIVGSRETWSPLETLLDKGHVTVIRGTDFISPKDKSVAELKGEVWEAVRGLIRNYAATQDALDGKKNN